MNNIEATRLLLEMRSLALKAQQSPAAGPTEGVAPAMKFGDAMKAAVGHVNDAQQKATALVTAFEAGEPGVDLTRVMLEVQKAGLSFKAMTEVRNKLVNAYQEIMNMPV